MLEEANRRKARGADIVIGILEPTIQTKLADAIGTLEIIPPTKFPYGGEEREELNLAEIKTRHPDYGCAKNSRRMPRGLRQRRSRYSGRGTDS